MRTIVSTIRNYLGFTFLLGLFYPYVVTEIGHAVFPRQTSGSFVKNGEQVIGSEWIAQKFESDRYFWPRPSAVDFNPLPSGGSNLGPISQALKEVFQLRKAKAGEKAPQSLLFASGSGLDPEIDPASALFQAPRVAQARGMPLEKVRSMVAAYTKKRQLGFLGEERINVLQLNRALDEAR